jgi:hypothetical protein
MRGTWQTTDGGGGGGAVVFMVAAVLLLGSGAASAIASAVTAVLIITGVVIVVAAAVIIALLVHRARSDRPRAVYSARPIPRAGGAERPGLPEPCKAAIEPPREVHLHFHTADPAEAAEIIRTAIPGQAGDAIGGE